MFKSTFGISKKKLVENYERQINNKNSDIHKLVKEVKYLEQELKSNEEKYNEDIQRISSERDLYKKYLKQTLIERVQLKKENIKLNEKNKSLKTEMEDLKVDNDKLTKKLIENGEIISELSERNRSLVSENKSLKQSNSILDELTEELIKEVDKLVNKKINRLESLKKRTKRLRIKKKCEARILELEKRYLD